VKGDFYGFYPYVLPPPKEKISCFYLSRHIFFRQEEEILTLLPQCQNLLYREENILTRRVTRKTQDEGERSWKSGKEKTLAQFSLCRRDPLDYRSVAQRFLARGNGALDFEIARPFATASRFLILIQKGGRSQRGLNVGETDIFPLVRYFIRDILPRSLFLSFSLSLFFSCCFSLSPYIAVLAFLSHLSISFLSCRSIVITSLSFSFSLYFFLCPLLLFVLFTNRTLSAYNYLFHDSSIIFICFFADCHCDSCFSRVLSRSFCHYFSCPSFIFFLLCDDTRKEA